MDKSSHQARLNAVAPRHIRARAALWVTDLQGPQRTAALDRRFRRWMESDPRHAAAFKLATDAWRRSALQAALQPLPIDAKRAQRRLWHPALCTAAGLIAAATVLLYVLYAEPVRTRAGEQRTLLLSDGTEIILSGNSRLSARVDRKARLVRLERGEALFHVAHGTNPFIVSVGDHKVVALGTTFDIRCDSGATPGFSVTLLEGRVAVEDVAVPVALRLPTEPSHAVALLEPGQRLRVAAGSASRVDRPALERVTAWQTGELIFDDVSLRDAAAEFSRYGILPITVDASVPERYRVGGVFHIHDPLGFADSLVRTYPLRATRRAHDLLLEAR